MTEEHWQAREGGMVEVWAVWMISGGVSSSSD